MAWISVDQKMVGGKLRKLYKAIGCSQNEAMGMLVGLWLWGIDNADADGLIVSAEREDIADVLRPGLAPGIDADAVVALLVEYGWIDEEDGKLYLHDWSEWRFYYNRFVDSKKKQADRTRKCRENKGKMAECNVTNDVTSNVTETLQEKTEEPQQAEPPAQKKKNSYSATFEEFWEAYPRKLDKGMAYKKYQARIKDGFSPEELLESAKAYARQCAVQKTEQKYIKHAKTFLGDSTPFRDFLPRATEPTVRMPEETGANPFRRQ